MEITKFFNSPKRNFFPSFFDSFIDRDSNWFQDFQPMTVPVTNIEESESAFILEVAVPGLNKEDISVELDNGSLRVFGQTESDKKEDEKKYKRREYSFSSFERVFHLPENITGEVDAKYDKGILKITIPKKEVVISNSKKIEVK